VPDPNDEHDRGRTAPAKSRHVGWAPTTFVRKPNDQRDASGTCASAPSTRRCTTSPAHFGTAATQCGTPACQTSLLAPGCRRLTAKPVATIRRRIAEEAKSADSPAPRWQQKEEPPVVRAHR
jgi:hypothetical protein